MINLERIFVVSASGRTAWVDYIPVADVAATPGKAGTSDEDGYFEVVELLTPVGVAWVDYIPVVRVPTTGRRWSTDNDGWTPIFVTGTI